MPQREKNTCEAKQKGKKHTNVGHLKYPCVNMSASAVRAAVVREAEPPARHFCGDMSRFQMTPAFELTWVLHFGLS